MKNILLIFCLLPVLLFGQKRVDQLPTATPGDTDNMILVRGGSFWQTTLAELKTYAATSGLDTMFISNDTIFAYTPADTFIVDLSAYLTAEVDGSVSNEIQTISIDSTGTSFTITLSNGGGSIVFEDSEGGVSTFTDLTDSPASYTGQANKMVLVNPGETGLIFADTSGLGGGGGGSTEVADGTTILGVGTAGDPFRVDTAFFADTGKTKYCGCRGQSNMEGQDGNPPANPQILLAQSGGTTVSWNPTNNNPCYSTALEWINNNPLDTVVCFWTASSGTSISEWYPSGSLRTTWEGILSDHGNPALDWSIWMQGEKDRDGQGINTVLTGAEADSNYYQNLIDSVYLYDTGQSYFDNRTPFVVALVYDGPGADHAGITRNNALIDVARDTFIWTSYADSDQLRTTDSLHFTDAAIDTLGRLFYDQIVSLPYNKESIYQEVSGGGGTAITLNEIAYGSGTSITSDSDLTRTANGLLIGSMKIEEGAGSNSIVHGNTAAASTGNNWIAQGLSAGAANTIGSDWVAQGSSAGESNISGGEWIAQGRFAGQSNESGSFWIAQGSGAGRFNLTGSNWIAQGVDAGRNNLTGSSWIAQGINAALNNVSGAGFVAQGNGSSKANTDGSNFTSLGTQSAENTTTGSNYTALGYRSARGLSGGAGSATSFSDGVYLGAQTKVGTNGASNEIVIGYEAEGRGSNKAVIGNSSITSLTSVNYTLNVDQATTGLDGYVMTYNETNDEIELQAANGGTMSSFTAAADTGTAAEIGDSETLTHTGGTGIDTDISGNTITHTLDLSELAALTTLSGDEFFALYDVGSASDFQTHIDTLLSYIENSVNKTGWAQYGDNTFTSGSPLTVAAGDTITLPVDAATGVIETYLPTGVDSLWSAADSTILAQQVGDAYTVRVNFVASSNNVNGYITQAIDFGDGTAPNWATSRVKTFPKGAGTAHNFSSTDQIYTLSSFLTNGGKIKIVGGVGTTSIYDIQILITRVHSP